MSLKTSRELYGHIDCNCFFVSCERLRRPELRGKFVVVAGDIIIAASYECRKYGISVGTPIWKAKQMLGSRLISVRPDLQYYTQVSQAFLSFLAEKTNSVEPFSIDEAFVDLTGIPDLNHGGDCENWANDLKQEILERVGIPVSIGISNTRIKAKILSDIRKPFGCTVGLDDERETVIFRELPVRDIPFVGRGTAERLGQAIKTVQDYRDMSFFELDRLIGKNATTLWLELHGVDVWRQDYLQKTQKSILRTRSFNQSMTDNKQVLWQRLLENFERAYRELTLIQCELSRVSVKLRDKELFSTWETYDFWALTSDRHRIAEAMKACFEAAWKPGILYRTTGVHFDGLTPAKPKQLSLFESEIHRSEREERLERVLAGINGYYGKRTVSYGIHPEQRYQA